MPLTMQSSLKSLYVVGLSLIDDSPTKSKLFLYYLFHIGVVYVSILSTVLCSACYILIIRNIIGLAFRFVNVYTDDDLKKRRNNLQKNARFVCRFRKRCYLCTRNRETNRLANKDGTIAQLVEQRTENPCVTGSIPVGTTQASKFLEAFLFPKN